MGVDSPKEATIPSVGPSKPMKLLFILGAPRSGTTWLQEIASNRHKTATVAELHLFSNYIRPLSRAWESRESQLRSVLDAIEAGGPVPDRAIGLPTVLTRFEFDEALRSFLRAVEERVRTVEPSTELLIEKTPSNSLLVPLINRLYPEAMYVHIIRDPRDVVRSLRTASRGWAQDWAPRSAALGALMWRVHVQGAREAEALGSDHYLEIRYEDIRGEDCGSVTRLEHFLESAGLEGVRLDRDEPLVVLSGPLSNELAGKSIEEPKEFGNGTSVRPSLSKWQKNVVELICADLMSSAGYDTKKSALYLNRFLIRTISMVGSHLSDSQQERIRLQLHHHRLRNLL